MRLITSDSPQRDVGVQQPTLDAEFLDRLRHDPDIFLSPVSLGEIAIKQTAGKLAGPLDLAERVLDMGFANRP